MDVLIALYLSSVPAALISNYLLTRKCYKTVKKENFRELKYKKNLGYRAKMHIKGVNSDYLYDQWYSFYHSLIPIGNILFSLETIFDYDYFYEEVDRCAKEAVRDANIEEDVERQKNAIMLGALKNKLVKIDDETKTRLDDSDYRISNKETKKILKLNKLNYNFEKKKFEEENGIKHE